MSTTAKCLSTSTLGMRAQDNNKRKGSVGGRKKSEQIQSNSAEKWVLEKTDFNYLINRDERY